MTRFPPVANGWGTMYQIWSHHSWWKESDHQLKRTKPRHDPPRSFYPTSMAMGGQDLTNYRPNLSPPCALGQHATGPPVAMPGGLQYRASDRRARVFQWCGYLMPDKTRRNHRTAYKRSHYPSGSSTRSRPPFIRELVKLSAHPL
jgi:hypothetical protein